MLSIQVAAATSVGDGAQSGPIYCRTLETGGIFFALIIVPYLVHMLEKVALRKVPRNRESFRECCIMQESRATSKGKETRFLGIFSFLRLKEQ